MNGEKSGRYLSFELGGESYALEVERVEVVLEPMPITRVPKAPAHLRGVINYRGTVIPVVDLRAKFGMSEAEYNRFTVVIVVNVGQRIVGLVVDAVSDVLEVAPTELVPTPEMGRKVDTSFLTGMAKSTDHLISLLAIDRVVGMDELEKAVA